MTSYFLLWWLGSFHKLSLRTADFKAFSHSVINANQNWFNKAFKQAVCKEWMSNIWKHLKFTAFETYFMIIKFYLKKTLLCNWFQQTDISKWSRNCNLENILTIQNSQYRRHSPTHEPVSQIWTFRSYRCKQCFLLLCRGLCIHLLIPLFK